MSTTYTLDPALPVLLRPDARVQIGWDPRRAVLVAPPAGLSTTALAALLRSLQVATTLAELHRAALRRGLADPEGLTAVLTALVTAGLVTAAEARVGAHPHRAATVRLHGRGPLTELLADGLAHTGVKVQCSSLPHAALHGADLVVLADSLIVDPRLLRDLHAARVPHLPVRVRDGTGLVGPLVLPGATSCLGCQELHRRDRDAAWPAVAVQLRDVVAHADRATLLATAALALGQIGRVVAAVGAPGRAGPAAAPPTLNATLEFDPAAGAILTRHWPRHPLCDC